MTRDRTFTIEEFTPRRTGALLGFATVALPSGMILADVGIYTKDGRHWASPPSRPMVGRDGMALKDDKGKTRYSPVVSFATKDLRDKFSNAVIEAILISHPNALEGQEPI